MAIKIIKKGIEVERLIGQQEVQMQVRAEALVPGAGRESVEALMADGFASVTSAEAQADRVVVSGSVFCQAAYRLGQEGGARALTAQALPVFPIPSRSRSSAFPVPAVSTPCSC